jgi:hypothetical protein
MTNKLTVTSVEVANDRLTISFSCKGQIKNFFVQNKFFVEYNTSIEGTPEAILIIPFLASICPIAWANQADVFVETMDETFLHSLGHVQKTLQKFYPQMKFGGKIYAKKIVTPHIDVQKNSMMLFSGGIDALLTYFRHQAENLILVRIHGIDIDLNNREAWNRFIGHIQAFSRITSSPLRIVRCNLMTIPDWLMLREYHPKLSGDWVGRVMHGLAFLGICAPLTYMDKVGKLYLASSFTDSVQIPWGSHPEIDNYVRWTGTNSIHDGYELSRQEKVEYLADYLKNKNPELFIRACNESRSDKNCSKCEKCSRTILGLELAGINPNKHGFAVHSDTFLRIKRNLAKRKWGFGDDEEFMWTDLQQHASRNRDLPHPQARVLIDWLLKVNVKTLRAPPPKPARFIPFFKYLPYTICRLTKRIYIALNTIIYASKDEQ